MDKDIQGSDDGKQITSLMKFQPIQNGLVFIDGNLHFVKYPLLSLQWSFLPEIIFVSAGSFALLSDRKKKHRIRPKQE
jgi:hypothetical protein